MQVPSDLINKSESPFPYERIIFILEYKMTQISPIAHVMRYQIRSPKLVIVNNWLSFLNFFFIILLKEKYETCVYQYIRFKNVYTHVTNTAEPELFLMRN